MSDNIEERLIQSSNSRRPVGRPRNKKTQANILRAVVDLLDTQTVRSLTIEMIAEQAKVGKTTIYRWWPDKISLVIDAFVELMTPSVSAPPPGITLAEMIAHFNLVADGYRGKVGRVAAEIIAEGQFNDSALVYFIEHVIRRRREFTLNIIKEERRNGHIVIDVDDNVLVDMLYGPLYFRLLLKHQSIDEVFSSHICRAFQLIVSRS